jgi:phenylpropionate dioxygenase-like ring-hydroxylating dioxygenase large terminal subunit
VVTADTQPLTLRALISRQRPGYSLEQAFYTSPEIYQIERRGWLAQQWFLVGHSSEVRQPGAYLVRDVLGESLIVVRDEKGELRAFYNVCRHRGSRVCDHDGKASQLVCPYHAWSYRLDGSLRSAPSLPDGTDVSELALKSVPLGEVGGLILVSLKGERATLDAMRREFEPGLEFHGIPEARIVARRGYPTSGNWKLVLENFIECYHCFPAHPEYCRVMKHVDTVAREVPGAAEAWRGVVDTWLAASAVPDSPLSVNPSPLKSAVCSSMRGPIGGGRRTQSEDGNPVAPLMGRLSRFDGGVSNFRCEPFVFFAALNDHAVMFRFSPIAAELTDVEITWLASGDADSAQIDVERMIWLWDVTTRQDKALIERNAAGIRSRSYAPGPYTTLEVLPARFVARYLAELDGAI